jgi:hypothetical protein
MVLIEGHGKQLLLAAPLAVAVTALTVTACGGGSAATAQGSAPGQWTKAEVSQFTAAGGGSGGGSQDSCIIGYFERDMSFGNAMAVVSVDGASGSSMSTAQIKAALVSKYGAAEGNTINTQFEQVVTDSENSCAGSAASPTADAAAPVPTADPAATSESSCTVDCVNPIASGESGWLAQVQGALQNVQQDLNNISSDTSNNPNNLALDGAQLEGDAQAALDPNYDPPPADNTDWVTAMNDYVTAGEDYSGDNTDEQDNNPAQASQQITAGNAALASFNTANGGVLNGTIQSSTATTTAPSTSPPATSTAAASPPATVTLSPSAVPIAAIWCSSASPAPGTASPSLSLWLRGQGYEAIQTTEATLRSLFAPNVPAATLEATSTSLCFDVLSSEAVPPPTDVVGYTTVMADFVAGSHELHLATSSAEQASAISALRASIPAFNAFLMAIGKPTFK